MRFGVLSRVGKPALAAGVVAGMLGAGGIAVATSGSDEQLFLCVKRSQGDLRVVGSARDCKSSEYAVAIDPRGSAGPAGPKGDKGDAGAAGAAGADGRNGTDGASGTDGTDGTNGTNGEKGEKGDTGPQGPAGPAGTGSGSGSGSPVVSVNRQSDNRLFELGTDSGFEPETSFTVSGPTLSPGRYLLEATIGVREEREDSVGTTPRSRATSTCRW